MAHLKSEFKYHLIFDNKYAQQTYIAYLVRGEKYVMNLNWIHLKVAKPIDFVIRCDNIIGRRQEKQRTLRIYMNYIISQLVK